MTPTPRAPGLFRTCFGCGKLVAVVSETMADVYFHEAVGGVRRLMGSEIFCSRCVPALQAVLPIVKSVVERVGELRGPQAAEALSAQCHVCGAADRERCGHFVGGAR